MTEIKYQQIRRNLRAAGYSMACLGRELGVHRGTVRRVILQPDQSRRIRERITEIIGYCPWADAAPPDEAA